MTDDVPGFSELVFSDLLRTRDVKPSWLRVAQQCVMNPGMLATVLLRIQQCLWRADHMLLAKLVRPVASVLVGADFNPGVTIGRGLWIAHPHGITIGFGLVIGDNVSMAGGVTAAASLRRDDVQRYAIIEDGVGIGAHAVLVGGITIGRNAMVGANSVVMKDVPADAVVMGNPARKIGDRDPTHII
jgi:serine O-acetyltransferase